MSDKVTTYGSLVDARKRCRQCCAIGLTNPASIQDGKFDSEEIGPWTQWNGDTNARLLVVGQEWGDVASFERQRGRDTASPTNQMLRELLASVGLPVNQAPTPAGASGVFLTNAALCLKLGGAQAPVQGEWFENCGRSFLRAQVEIVRPAVVVTLGDRAYRAMRQAFDLPRAGFRRAVNLRAAIPLPTGGFLVPVYHCGQRILNTHRKRAAQFEDWQLVQQLLASAGDAKLETLADHAAISRYP